MTDPMTIRAMMSVLCAAALPCAVPAVRAAGADSPATYVAPYISEQSQALIRAYVPGPKPWSASLDAAAWTAVQQESEQAAATRLQQYAEGGAAFERKPADVPGVRAYWFTTPKTATDGPVLVYTHGGAYVIGSGREVSPAILAIAEASGMRVLSIDYRLAPQHPFPAAVDDSVAAYRWLLEQGIASNRIGWFGESAGGGLMLAAMHALKRNELPLPGAIVALSAWTDLTVSSESYFTLDAADPAFSIDEMRMLSGVYRGQASPLDPLVSPVLGDFSGFPPLLIQVGSKEILLSDSLRVARRARSAGVDVELDIWDGMWHVFQLMGVPESREAIDEIGAFFRRHLIR